MRWWMRNRLTSPIVIDATGEGDRWLPEIIVQKWPNLNRIDVDKRQAETAVTAGDAGFADRVRERIIGAIRQTFALNAVTFSTRPLNSSIRYCATRSALMIDGVTILPTRTLRGQPGWCQEQQSRSTPRFTVPDRR
jgi:hypothetical protein